MELTARMLSKSGHNVRVITLDSQKNVYDKNLSFNVIESQSKLGTRLGTLMHAYQVMSDNARSTDIFYVFSPALLAAAGYFRKQNDTTPAVGRLLSYTMFCVNITQMDGECHQNCTARAKFTHQEASLGKRIAKIPLYSSRTYVEPKLSRNLDAYFAISPAVKKIYSEVGIPENKISTIPNLYDPTFGSDKMLAGRRCSDEPVQLLHVGRIEPAKGIDCLIKALAQTSRIELTIVGDGSALSDLRALVDSKGIKDRVYFEGWVQNEDLPSYYRSADLFVHPARFPEPSPRTLLESMQMGTPALVADIGGLPWVAGEAGIVFPPEDTNRLSEILLDIQDNRAKLREIKDNCVDQLEQFRPQNVISSIEREFIRLRE
jgi:glycosyltransferase involved in cell wall biosynthesis